MEPLKGKEYELYFGDEMRYGLISNFRRSWSKIGERGVILNQQIFEDRYLFSAVAPLSGDSCHLIGVEGFDSEAMHAFLLELKKKHLDRIVIIVVDNAPGHRPKIHRAIPGLILLFLPPYSPELNPAERFFEELRRATANQTFLTLEEKEWAIEQKLIALTDDRQAMKQLLGYEWIKKQTEQVS